MTVLAARGGELEREFSYGVVRQLFEAHLARASPSTRKKLLAGAAALAAPVVASSEAEPSFPGDPGFPILHGLYWLAANLATETPIALTVDDVHHADRASLRWLAFVAPRLDGVPLLVALTRRTGDAASDDEALGALAADRATCLLRPGPLSLAATSHLVRTNLPRETSDELCSACHRATGGNPFLLSELLGELKASPSGSGALSPDRIAELRPDAVARAVLVRLGRLPDSATTLAKAVALLGDGAELRLAASLADVEPEVAEEAADLLARANVLSPARPLAFVHPLVRTAVTGELGPGERAQGHARAANLLRAEGAQPHALAPHLVAADPCGDPEAVALLREAATWALARGAPDLAAGYLQRALREPPRQEDRAAVLVELGRAENRLASPDAVDHLEAAVGAARSDRDRVEAAHELAFAVFHANRPSQAVAILERAVDELPDVDLELRLRLERDLISFGLFDNEASPRVRARLRALTQGAGEDVDSMLLADLAFDGYVTGRPANEVVQLAEQALADPRLLAFASADRPEYYFAVTALLFSDRYEAAANALGSVLTELRAQGSALGVALASCFKAMLEMRQGRLSAAEENALGSLEIPGSWRPMALATLVEVLLERGDLAAAREALETSDREQWPEGNQNLHLPQHRRGLLHLAEGRPEAALADFLEAGRREREWGASNPSVLPWRSSAALANLALGRSDEARALAAEELALARSFAAPRAIGIALRVGALAEHPARQIDQLEEAVRVLGPSGASLEYARALLNLGSAFRRSQHRSEAREPLRAALDLAHRCGATPLVDTARQELRAIGVRAPHACDLRRRCPHAERATSRQARCRRLQQPRGRPGPCSSPKRRSRRTCTASTASSTSTRGGSSTSRSQARRAPKLLRSIPAPLELGGEHAWLGHLTQKTDAPALSSPGDRVRRMVHGCAEMDKRAPFSRRTAGI